jgi:glycosyltransferase involved in cell wall biosynthesis
LHPEIIAVPRLVTETPNGIPSRVAFVSHAAGSKIVYTTHVLRIALMDTFDGVICGHINLLPLAALAAARRRVPLLLVIHGIEAWRPHRSPLVRLMVRRIHNVVAVSELTRQRFLHWSGVQECRVHVIPNCIHIDQFGTGEKRGDLMARYGLKGRTVMLTMARLSSTERYKGVDELLELLPTLRQHAPHIAYLVVGDGDDRSRLQAKAQSLGLSNVTFTGHVPEIEKADHFRLADVFVMPGRGEGFGIVYLEALACGVPVVASIADASREAVLNGALGEMVNPDDPQDIISGILRALARPEREVPPLLQHFSYQSFRERWHSLLAETFRVATSPATGLKSTAVVNT